MNEPKPLLTRVIDAYGGAVRWRALGRISLRVSANGLAFRMKWQAPIVRRSAEVDVHEPRVRFFPEADDDLVEVFAGDEVHLERSDGSVVEARSNPRRYFPGGRRFLWWDRLDQVYFAGYALWNYVTFPALLLRDDIDWQEAGPSTLRGRFPETFPTHNEVQEFHFDPAAALLRQHDYTASVFGDWAKGAHRVLSHEEVDGIPFGTRRRVTPRLKSGKPAPFPLLVGIQLEEIELNEPSRG